MEGGGLSDSFKLGDIGNYTEVSDLASVASASLVGMNAALVAARAGGLGGFSMNTYFDTFGLEGVLANICLILIVFQVARWAYTTFYTAGGVRAWSPFVFVCVLLAVQFLHDIIFYYGAIQALPSGRNEMIDMLKKYAAENGSRALGGHAIFLIVVAVVAMFLKETSMAFGFLVTTVSLYVLPFVISTFGPKPPPPPPKKETKEQFAGGGGGGFRWNGPTF